MNYLFIILDSCRYDTYKEVYAEIPFFKKLGPLHKASSNSNITVGSFILMFGHSYFPHPRPNKFPFNPSINFLSKFDECCKILVTGMPLLWPKHDSMKGLLKKFDIVNYCDTHTVCKQGVEEYNSSREQNLFFVLWTGETHMPYEVEKGGTRWFPDKVKRYNRGENCLGPSYIKHLRDRQKEMIRYCGNQLSKLKIRKPVHIVVTSDHGESFGENHVIGHAQDNNAVQFLVPLQYKLLL